VTGKPAPRSVPPFLAPNGPRPVFQVLGSEAPTCVQAVRSGPGEGSTVPSSRYDHSVSDVIRAEP